MSGSTAGLQKVGLVTPKHMHADNTDHIVCELENDDGWLMERGVSLERLFMDLNLEGYSEMSIQCTLDDIKRHAPQVEATLTGNPESWQSLFDNEMVPGLHGEWAVTKTMVLNYRSEDLVNASGEPSEEDVPLVPERFDLLDF